MLAFAIPFPRFSGSKFKVVRFQSRFLENGIYRFSQPSVLDFPGRIQPSTDIKNLKSQYGETVSAGIEVATPVKYELQIETKTTENDYIIYRNSIWKVERSIRYDQLIPHNEAVATLVTNPGTDLKNLLAS